MAETDKEGEGREGGGERKGERERESGEEEELFNRRLKKKMQVSLSA